MSSHNNENLDELLNRFFDTEGAKEAAQDIAKGEQILRRHPAPAPDEETIELIKARVVGAIARNKAKTSRAVLYRAVAVAAAVIVIGVLSVRLFENRSAEPVKVPVAPGLARSMSEGDEFFNDDSSLETLGAEVEQAGSEIATLEWEKMSENADSDLIDAEMTFMNIDSDFWKG